MPQKIGHFKYPNWTKLSAEPNQHFVQTR